MMSKSVRKNPILTYTFRNIKTGETNELTLMQFANFMQLTEAQVQKLVDGKVVMNWRFNPRITKNNY